MGRWSSLASDKEGVSNVVAVVLLVGLTLTGVAVILATGWVSINETNQQADMEIAEESMLQIDSTLEQSGGGNTTIALPNELEGKVAISNDQTYELTLNNNSECSTGERPLSSIEYDDNGQAVAYEGGGVWRMTESGATMVSPPNLEYTQGTFDISFSEINGSIKSTDELTVQTNTTAQREHQFRLARALYSTGNYTSPAARSPSGSDNACSPSDIENATLEVRGSKYASAWAQWAHNNYDSDLVTVTSPESVDAGDTVNMTFALGDVSRAMYNVSDIRATRAAPGEDVEVTATIVNTGGLRETKPVTLDYNGTEVDSTTVSVGGGDRKQVTLNISSAVLETGQNNITVTADNETTESLRLRSIDGVDQTKLDTTDIPSKSPVGVTPDADLIVENTGNMTAFEQVTMQVDGKNRTWNVTVGPKSSRSIYVGPFLPNDRGAYNVTFESAVTGSAVSIDPYTVGDSAYLDVQLGPVPSGVESGDTVSLEATVENRGGQTATDEPVTLNITKGGSPIYPSPNRTKRVTLDGTAVGSENETVSFTYTADDGSGRYSYQISSPDNSKTAVFNVERPPAPYFLFRGISVSKTTVVMGNETTFDVPVNNSGTRAGNQTVRLINTATGTVLKQDTIGLDPGEEKRRSWTVDVTEPNFQEGRNKLTLSTDNVTVEQTITALSEEPDLSTGDGELLIKEGINATITMEGAELESRVNRKELPSPTEMELVIENDTGEYTRTLWTRVPETGANVNHPRAEERMQAGGADNPYTVDLTLEKNTTLALFATSYECDYDIDWAFSWYSGWYAESINGYQDTGIDHENRGTGSSTYAMSGYECTDTGGELVSISPDSSPGNVVIREDGDVVPNPKPAMESQLSVRDMIGDRIDSNDTLQLARGERLFLYELSVPNASYKNANKDDPDYNDAIARFQITSRNTKAPEKFVIIDSDAPAQIERDDDVQINATVGNGGGQDAETPVTVSVGEGADKVTRTKNTSVLDAGETETLTFTLDGSSLSQGESHPWVINATATDKAKRTGFVYVGESTDPFFQVERFNGTDVADSDDSPVANVVIGNIEGTRTDTQNVTLEVNNADKPSEGWTTVSYVELTLDPGKSTTEQLDLPATPGNYSYRVSTDNVTTEPLELLVGTSEVTIARDDTVNIRTDSWDADELVDIGGSASEMRVKLVDEGTVADDREVRLEVRNDTDTVFESVKTKEATVEDLTGKTPMSTNLTFQTDLDTGFYNYTITVYEDTESSGTVADTVSGEIYLRDRSSIEANPDDSPISVDSGTITVG